MSASTHNIVQNYQLTNESHHLLQKYISKKKRLYNTILILMENSYETAESKDNDINILKQIIDNEKYEENREELIQILQMINHITNNHHRGANFFSKIKQIIEYFKDIITKTLTNSEIFNIFKNNKFVLKFLFNRQIINVTEEIYKEMINKIEANGNYYCHFFYPEIKEFIDNGKKNEFFSEFSMCSENFEEKRNIGENDSYICTLIRQDAVEEFIAYVTQTNMSLKSEIHNSIFETNPFLIENENTSLIEYSAFFGSIQIFQYLIMNKVELTPSLWLYAIHSQNAELIHILESYKVEPPKFEKTQFSEEIKYFYAVNHLVDFYLNEIDYADDQYERCLIESIKCHHNDIAEYILINLFSQNDKERLKKSEKITSSIFQYYNYAFFPTEIEDSKEFYYLCSNGYSILVKLFLEMKEEEIKEYVIQNVFKKFFVFRCSIKMFF